MSYSVREPYNPYHQHYGMYQSGTQQSQLDVAQSLTINPYAHFVPSTGEAPSSHSQNHQQHQQQQRQQVYHQQQLPHSRSEQSSPIGEDGSKPSLPSISNLLGIADGDRPGQEGSVQHVQNSTGQPPSKATQSQSQMLKVNTKDHSLSNEVGSGQQRAAIPPTPPLRSDSVVEGTQSPSTISSSSSLSAQPYYVASSINNLDPEHQRVVVTSLAKPTSAPHQPSTSPYHHHSPYISSQLTASPTVVANPSYYPSAEHTYASSQVQPTNAMYHQQPLPTDFPPKVSVPVQPSPASLTTPNPWEHHHYIAPSSHTTYPNSQDRYICPNCNKAFSRPSSLKIHSYSHTGEKPFRCLHPGCGKAFSVRSNMKRHQRGCHSGAAAPIDMLHGHNSSEL